MNVYFLIWARITTVNGYTIMAAVSNHVIFQFITWVSGFDAPTVIISHPPFWSTFLTSHAVSKVPNIAWANKWSIIVGAWCIFVAIIGFSCALVNIWVFKILINFLMQISYLSKKYCAYLTKLGAINLYLADLVRYI